MKTKSNIDYSVSWICTVITIAVCVLCCMMLCTYGSTAQADVTVSIFKIATIVFTFISILGLFAFMFTYYLHGKCSNDKEQMKSHIKVLEDKSEELEESLKKINIKLDSMDSKFPSNVGDRVSVLEKEFDNLNGRVPFFPKNAEINVKWPSK